MWVIETRTEELNELSAAMVARTTVNNADDKACEQTKKTPLILHIKGATEDKIIIITTLYILTVSKYYPEVLPFSDCTFLNASVLL